MSKDLLYSTGVGLLTKKQYAQAVEHFTKAKDAGYAPDDAAFQYNLGIAYAHLGNFDEAIAALTIAAGTRADAFQSLVFTHHGRFNHELSTNGTAAAAAVFDTMLAQLPHGNDLSAQHLLNARAQLLRAFLRNDGISQEDIISAMGKYCNIGVTLQNGDTFYFNAHMGKVYLDRASLLGLGEEKNRLLLASAEALLGAANEISAGDQAVLNNLAIAQEALGQWQDAVRTLAHSAIETGTGTLRENLCAILINHHRPELAAQVLALTDGVDPAALIGELEAIS